MTNAETAPALVRAGAAMPATLGLWGTSNIETGAESIPKRSYAKERPLVLSGERQDQTVALP
jgi:hypothetical protein